MAVLLAYIIKLPINIGAICLNIKDLWGVVDNLKHHTLKKGAIKMSNKMNYVFEIKNRYTGEVIFTKNQCLGSNESSDKDFNLKWSILDALRIGISLANADLEGVNLTGMDLANANFEGASLVNADLTQTNLNGANLEDANLEQANLTDADLRGANLTGAYMVNTNLTDADLRGALMTGVIFKPINNEEVV